MTIYNLSICLPTENWVSVVTSHRQNADEPTDPLTQTASVPVCVIIAPTWAHPFSSPPGETEALSFLIAGTWQGWE